MLRIRALSFHEDHNAIQGRALFFSLIDRAAVPYPEACTYIRC